MRRALVWVIFAAAGACSDPITLTPDAGTLFFGDAEPADASAFDTGAADVGPEDVGTPGSCSELVRVDGLVHGRVYPTSTFVIDPNGAMPATFPAVVETDTYSAAGIARLDADRGLLWGAQISNLGGANGVTIADAVHDPRDGATYAAVEALCDGALAVRFYSADGTLAKAFTPGAAAGSDLVGVSSQRNFFLVRYSAVGRVEWVKRFGPDEQAGLVSGTIQSIGVFGDRIRVIVTLSDAGPLIFGPGEPGALARTGFATGLWADFQRLDGTYVPGSARFVEPAVQGPPAALAGIGRGAITSAGDTAIAGAFSGINGPTEFVIGDGGAGSMTMTSSRTAFFFAKVGLGGAPIFAGRGTRLGDGSTAGTITSFGIGEGGELVVAGRLGPDVQPFRFSGPTGFRDLEVGAQSAAWIVLYSPSGEVRWVKAIVGDHPSAVTRVIARSDGVYVVGGAAVGTVFGPREGNELTLTVPAWYLAKLSLVDGAFEWARMIEPADPRDSPVVAEAWPIEGGFGLEIYTRVSFTFFDGFTRRSLTVPGTPAVAREVVLTRLTGAGTFSSCGLVAQGPAWLRLD